MNNEQWVLYLIVIGFGFKKKGGGFGLGFKAKGWIWIWIGIQGARICTSLELTDRHTYVPRPCGSLCHRSQGTFGKCRHANKPSVRAAQVGSVKWIHVPHQEISVWETLQLSELLAVHLWGCSQMWKEIAEQDWSRKSFHCLPMLWFEHPSPKMKEVDKWHASNTSFSDPDWGLQ